MLHIIIDEDLAQIASLDEWLEGHELAVLSRKPLHAHSFWRQPCTVLGAVEDLNSC